MDLKEKVKHFTALKRQAKVLKAELNAVKAEATAAGEELLADMLEAELQNIKGADGSVVYIRREFQPSVIEGHMPVLVHTLIDGGQDSVVSVNSMTLKGLVNDALRVGAEAKGLKLDTLSEEDALALLPENLRANVKLGTKTTVEAKGL